MTIEADALGTVHQDLDCILVVQDHLGLPPALAVGLLAGLDQLRGLQQGIGVSLQATRIPGQIDQ